MLPYHRKFDHRKKIALAGVYANQHERLDNFVVMHPAPSGLLGGTGFPEGPALNSFLSCGSIARTGGTLRLAAFSSVLPAIIQKRL
jgi:hypothetical protein